MFLAPLWRWRRPSKARTEGEKAFWFPSTSLDNYSQPFVNITRENGGFDVEKCWKILGRFFVWKNIGKSQQNFPQRKPWWNLSFFHFSTYWPRGKVEKPHSNYTNAENSVVEKNKFSTFHLTRIYSFGVVLFTVGQLILVYIAQKILQSQ